ncbi:hypothetical protein [Streptomyces sp. NPDC001292]|uniref:hypothetical protein n=1 Tax=Streptomyces sp. NPDC001292 TaxID=3364558 RepID=UPI0036ABBC09
MTGMINGRFHLLPQAEKRQGGMSEVRKAVDVLSPEGAYAAVKLLKRRDDEESTRIFLDRETASLRALTHPNIVRMLDSGWDEGLEQYFIVLEWVDRSLKDEMSGAGRWTGRPTSPGSAGRWHLLSPTLTSSGWSTGTSSPGMSS